MISINSHKFILSNRFGAISIGYLKYIVIFTAWPVLSLGFSITMYLFYFLLYRVSNIKNLVIYRLDAISGRFYLFGIVTILSLIFSPWEVLEFNFIDEMQLLVQYLYWIMVAVFFMRFRRYINPIKLEQYLLLGLFFLSIQFFIFNFYFPNILVRTFVSRNSYVFTVLSLWPIAARYIFHSYGRLLGNFSLITVVLLILLTEGRAGFLIIFIESFLIFFIFNGKRSSNFRIIFSLSIIISTVTLYKVINDERRQIIGDYISLFSPRIGEFVKGEGDGGDLSFDKSWLTRELMIEKGMEIITDYPFFGVGVGHFSKYKADLHGLYDPQYNRLVGGEKFDEEYYNKKSAHNTYIHVLSEFGILGFISFLIILLPVLVTAIYKAVTMQFTEKDLPYVSLLGISMHFYTISSFTGMLTWFILGLVYFRRYFDKDSLELV